MNARTGIVFLTLALWVGGAMGLGCAEKPTVSRGAPQAVFRPPTKDRPIVPSVGDPEGLFVFGGPDGAQRIRMKRPPGFMTSGWSRDGRMVATLTDDGAVTFYDVSGRDVGAVRLPKYRPPEPGVRRWARMYISSRRQAIVALTDTLELPRYKLRAAWPAPVGPFPPPKRAYYYVDMNEKAMRMTVGEIDAVVFGAGGGFALLIRSDRATPAETKDPWRVLWFDQPERPSWELVLPGRSYLYGLHPGWDFTLRLPARRLIMFRADGEFAMVSRESESVSFQKGNPNYVKRAGGGYEKTYLYAAVVGLDAAVELSPELRPAVRAALRSYIYDYLSTFTWEGGRMYPAEFRRCMAALDARMAEALTFEQYGAYVKWRRGKHALSFLMHPPMDPDRPLNIKVRKL